MRVESKMAFRNERRFVQERLNLTGRLARPARPARQRLRTPSRREAEPHVSRDAPPRSACMAAPTSGGCYASIPHMRTSAPNGPRVLENALRTSAISAMTSAAVASPAFTTKPVCFSDT